jgi:SNF2 family DNA or RNA helicase
VIRADLGESGMIRVTAGYTDTDRMTQIPGATHDRRTETWKIPLSWASCCVLRGVFGKDLEVGEKLKDWSWNIWTLRIEPALKLRELVKLPEHYRDSWPIAEIEKNSDLKLKPYQWADVAFMATAGTALLANEPGLGKTASMIRTLQVLAGAGDPSPLPALVVCPNSLKITVWKRELEKWSPELSVVVIDGGVGARRKQLTAPADVYVINWDLLRYHSRLAPYGQETLTEAQKTPKELNALEYHTIILDEAHKLLNPKSQVTRAAWSVMKDAHFRFALTGTPIGDHVGDLWGLLHGIDPAGFPGKTRYMERYAQTSWGLWGGLEVLGLRSDTAEEFRKVTEPVMRRMLKAVVLPQLPPKLPVAYRHTPMTPKQAKAYQQMSDDMTAELNELLIATDPLVKLIRLTQFAAASAETETTSCSSCYGKGERDGAECRKCAGSGSRQTVKLSAPSSKVDDLVEFLEELGEEQLVVCAVSKQLIKLAAARLEKEKISHGLVTGDQDTLERDMAISRFQSGKIRVILFTLGTGAEGITLTAASKILFMQESWRTLENTQAEDRIHRIGAEKHDSIQVIKQITPGTVEEAKISILAGKLDRIEEVLRDRELMERLLGTEQTGKRRKVRKPDGSSDDDRSRPDPGSELPEDNHVGELGGLPAHP